MVLYLIKYKLILALSFLAFTILFHQSCKKDPTGYNPINEVVLSENAVLIDSNSVTAPTVQGNTVIFKVDGTEPQLNVGDVIVIQSGGGHIKKINSIQSDANTVRLTTTNGKITDVYDYINIIDEVPFNPANNKINKYRPAPEINEIYEPLDGEIIYEGRVNGVNITAKVESGHVRFNPSFPHEIFYDKDNPDIRFKLITKGDFELDCKIAITVDGNLEIPKKVKLFTYSMPFSIGIVPALINIDFIAGVNFDLNTSGTITTGMKLNTFLEFGAYYDHLGWHVVDKYGDPTPTGYDPTWEANSEVNMRGYLTPEISLSIVGVAGPSMSIEPYMNFNGGIDYSRGKWQWNLVGGFDGNVGFKMDIFGFLGIDDYIKTLVNYEVPISDDSGDLSFIYFDNFESYSPNQLDCQSSNNWVTWNNVPCDGAEDPIVIDWESYSGNQSLLIQESNDIVFNFDEDFTSGTYKISFYQYIDSGYTGYYNILMDFGANIDWGVEVRFNSNGTGSVDIENQNDVGFNYTQRKWIQNEIVIDLDNDLAQITIDGIIIHKWKWSDGGINQLAAVNFYGVDNAYYYIDDFSVDYAEPLSDDNPQPNPTTEIEFVEVPAGSFAIGSTPNAGYISYDYQISKYEITNAQYVQFLNEALSAGYVELNSTYIRSNYIGDAHHSAGLKQNYRYGMASDPIKWDGSQFSVESGYENHPPDGVNWFGAWSFANYYGYRLPTDDEWEKAARGQLTTHYSWGNDLDGKRANFYNSGDPWDNDSTPAGYYNGQNGTLDSPSPYGCYDMSGNVEEWIFDISTSDRPIRGGGYPSVDVKIEQRYTTAANSMSNVRGFRVVK